MPTLRTCLGRSSPRAPSATGVPRMAGFHVCRAVSWVTRVLSVTGCPGACLSIWPHDGGGLSVFGLLSRSGCTSACACFPFLPQRRRIPCAWTFRRTVCVCGSQRVLRSPCRMALRVPWPCVPGAWTFRRPVCVCGSQRVLRSPCRMALRVPWLCVPGAWAFRRAYTVRCHRRQVAAERRFLPALSRQSTASMQLYCSPVHFTSAAWLRTSQLITLRSLISTSGRQWPG